MRLSLLSIALVVPMLLAAQTPGRPDVSGTWIEQSNGANKWILAEKDGSMHVTEMTGDKVETDFICPLTGRECEIKQQGRPEKMMVYYNGNKLVEIREGRDGVEKKRLSVSSDGKTLNVEIVPLSSKDKKETLSFQRQSA
jgi:hypothetical protein